MTRGRPMAFPPTLLPVLLAGLLGLLLPSGRVAEAADAASGVFTQVARGWAGRSATNVAAAMELRGRLTLSLKDPQVRGSFSRPQAERTLLAYFRQVARPRLKDVTPKRHRNPAGYRTRIYEYAYQRTGHDPVTSLLVITLRQGRGSRWHLVSIEEKTRRTTSR